MQGNEYTVYCDGGCRNKHNVRNEHVTDSDKSAYAFLVTFNGQPMYKHTHGFYGKTNNQMELSAVIQALRYMIAVNANKRRITVVSDSRYVDNAINQHWIDSWHKRGWKRSHGKLKNAKLWKMLHREIQQCPRLSFRWTKGHSDGKTEDSRGNIFVDHALNHTMDALPSKKGQQ